MGRMKYTDDFKLYFSDFTVFSIRDARQFLLSRGASRGYASLFMHNMLSRGVAYRMARGYYSTHEDVRAAGFAFAPFYYGLMDALTIHKVGTQVANPTIITMRKARIGVRQVLGRNMVVRRISRPMFFGYDVIYYSGFNVPVSDLEKTVIDALYFGLRLDRETFEEAFKRSDKEKLARYFKRAAPHLRISALRSKTAERIAKLALGSVQKK